MHNGNNKGILAFYAYLPLYLAPLPELFPLLLLMVMVFFFWSLACFVQALVAIRLVLVGVLCTVGVRFNATSLYR
jgi:hypothetical protein